MLVGRRVQILDKIPVCCVVVDNYISCFLYVKVGNNQGNIFVRRMKPIHRCVERVKCALRCVDSGTCSLLNCFDMAPVFSLWISSSFGSSFVVEAARRDHELLSLSPKAKSLNTV